MYKFQTGKDVKKVIRSILELIIFILLLGFIVYELFDLSKYEPFDSNDKSVVSGADNGFIAVSYIGVDRDGTNTLISTDKLDDHLKALCDNGYVTITQEDIEAYYRDGKKLPDKALYLMFEDGRKDSAIFAQKIMEKYNDIATMMTYAEDFEHENGKMLTKKDVAKLNESSYWEMGANGYRISYINAYDKYGRYLGELNANEYVKMSKYLGRNYNHYLMDFIRDENNIPMETSQSMRNRISHDYELMEEKYKEAYGYVPKAYVLLHANTGRFGTNDKASEVNEACIKNLYTMNFNREGFSLNNADNSIYDLTRIQPQAYWSTNHLLMRIKDDLPEERQGEISFVDGDVDRKSSWEVLSGASEFEGEDILLTSQSEGDGMLRLKNSEGYKNLSVDVELNGNVLGCQNVILRGAEDGSSGIYAVLKDNIFYIYDGSMSGEPAAETDLYRLDGNTPVSIDEDKKATLLGEYQALAQTAGSVGEATEYLKAEKEADESIKTMSVAEGAEEYFPTIQINSMASRKLHIELYDDKISCTIDGKPAVTELKVATLEPGYVLIQSAWGEYGYSQRNLADDVYDGIFSKMTITDENGESLYTNCFTKWENHLDKNVKALKKILNWFIKNL